MKYKLYKKWVKFQYIKFILSDKNSDWDFYALLNLNIKKLTMMGLYFAKWGVVIDVERKKQVRTIWQARHYLLNTVNAYDIIEKRAQKEITEKYGSPFKYGEMITESKKNGDYIFKGFILDSPKVEPDKEKEVRDLYHSYTKKEYPFMDENVKKAFEVISSNIFTWWD